MTSGGRQLQYAFVIIFSCAFLNLLFRNIDLSTDFLADQEPEQEDGGRRMERFPPTDERREVSNDESGEDFSRIFNASCPTDYLGITDYAKRICEGESPKVCRLFSCRNFLTGNGNDLYYGRARQLMKRWPRKSLPDRFFRNLTSDCALFRKASGFQLRPTNADEESFPIAFNILAHSSAEQVLRLVRVLYRPQNVFCIHVDAKASPDLIEAITAIARCFDNIRLASRLERIIYAGYSRLQADINCMKDNMESKSRWKYLINTAAQAYPLRSIGEIIRILRIYNGANDVEGLYGRDVIKIRYEREWGEEGGQIAEVGRAHSKPPHNIDIVRGSAYGVFSRAFVRFILEDRRAIDLLNWSRNTFSPDEHYWATLHHTYSNPHLHTPGGFSGIHKRLLGLQSLFENFNSLFREYLSVRSSTFNDRSSEEVIC